MSEVRIAVVAIGATIAVTVVDLAQRRDVSVVFFLVLLTGALIAGVQAWIRPRMINIFVALVLSALGGSPFIGGVAVRLIALNMPAPVISLTGMICVIVAMGAFVTSMARMHRGRHPER
jgi:hypothetical protein